MGAKRRWEVGAAAALALVLLVAGAGGGSVWYRQRRAAELRHEMLTAITQGDAAAVARLAREGADLRLVGENGGTALMAIGARGDAALARKAVFAGVDVNQGTISGKQTALMHAASNGNGAVAKVLIAAGARVNAPDWTGVTPLMFAASSGDLATVETLLDAGADLHARDRSGRTALSFATNHKGADEVVRLLRKRAGGERK